jgi:hypothetical protein
MSLFIVNLNRHTIGPKINSFSRVLSLFWHGFLKNADSFQAVLHFLSLKLKKNEAIQTLNLYFRSQFNKLHG